MKIYSLLLLYVFLQISVQEENISTSYNNYSDKFFIYSHKKYEVNYKILTNLYDNLKFDNCLILFKEEIDIFEILQYTNSKNIIKFTNISEILANFHGFHTYILIITTLENLQFFLETLKKTTYWNNKAKYLILTTNANINTEELFNLTLNTFNLLNVNIIIKPKNEMKLFTHYPYYKGSCGNNTKPFKLTSKNKILYPEKLPRDVQGCPIRLTGVKIIPYVLDIAACKDDPRSSGLEVTVIYNVFQRMNFTQIFVENTNPHWGYMLPDGNFTMTYKKLYEKEVDVIFGMMIGNETMSKHFDVTVSHIDTTAVWFVPVALPIAQWKNLTAIFDGIVWLSILIVVISNGVSWWILGRNRETSEAYNEISLCLMGSFYILLQGSFNTPQAWKLRFVVIIWSVSSLLLFTAHQCQLTGILTSPLYEHQISNIKEMVDSKLDYGFYPVLRSLYRESNSTVHKKLLRKVQPCPLTAECMNRTAFKRDFATIKNKREAAFLMSKYYSFPSGKPMVYNFEVSEFVVWCKYYVEKGFHFLDKMNEKILLLQSSGLIAKWERDLVSGSNVKIEVSELEPLTLNHLQGAFFLLIFGSLLSLVLFAVEKSYYKLNATTHTVDSPVN